MNSRDNCFEIVTTTCNVDIFQFLFGPWKNASGDPSHFDEEMKEEIISIGNNLAKYLFQNDIHNVMFLDRSARPGYIALKGAWKKKFPNVPAPNIYFTNPEGYNTNNRSTKEIQEEFDRVYKRLAADKNAKIMLFDVCMHHGEALGPVFDFLKKAGYTQVVVGLAQPEDDRFFNKIPIKFLALKYPSASSCYPFSKDYLIEKNRTSVLSFVTKNQGDKEHSIQLRKELSSLFD